MPRHTRRPRTAVVLNRERLAPNMVRLRLRADDLQATELSFTDSYIKFILPRPGSGLTWPFDPEQARESLPAEQQPVLRAYTIRAFDPDAATMTVDVVTHGDEGIAGVWATTATPGESVGFVGPGGAWKPSGPYQHFVLAGDESAAPAIAAALEALPEGTTATVFLEVDHPFEVPQPEGVTTHWLMRGNALPGDPLVQAVRSHEFPAEPTGWFVHGVAEMVRDLRRHLFVERGVPREAVSISGYWRRGMTDEQWRATKKEFNAQLEADLNP
ncbi:MAG: siderophore-interacting protein [Propionibacteriaceae bacterium]|nr:siderophore-interacting protein [Propionibacteriaceae bacterium]